MATSNYTQAKNMVKEWIKLDKIVNSLYDKVTYSHATEDAEKEYLHYKALAEKARQKYLAVKKQEDADSRKMEVTAQKAGRLINKARAMIGNSEVDHILIESGYYYD